MTFSFNGSNILKIKCCRSCGSTSLENFLDLGDQPFANSLVSSIEITEKKYELALTFCCECGMVQLTATAEPSELFSHYLWVTGTSSTARNQADIFCDNAISRLDRLGNSDWVCEVASNDGTFLLPFISRGMKVLGIDPAANIVERANESGIPTKCGFFSENLATELIAEHGPASVVIARNVLAHVASPIDFVHGLARLIEDAGIVILEFHYGRKILSGLQYDSIYHEHLCYITASSVIPLLKLASLEVFDIEEGPISGGALIVFAQKIGGGRRVCKSVENYLANERREGLGNIQVWHDFAKSVNQHRVLLNEYINDEIDSGAHLVGYGASARSSTMLNFCGIRADRLPVIADQNPLKQGLYTAGTHVKVCSPEDVFSKKIDTVLLLAWNFKSEIIEILSKRIGFSGKVIVPLPNLPLLETLN